MSANHHSPPIVDVDMDAFWHDPYPVLAQLRADSPVAQVPQMRGVLLTRHQDIVISEKNYIDMSGKAILCHTQMSEYARSYCWIHGTSYVRQALQGQATGCFVDQTRIQSDEDAPVTAYYLWLPYLLTVCFLLARLPRSLWKRFLECGLARNILAGRGGRTGRPAVVAGRLFNYIPSLA